MPFKVCPKPTLGHLRVQEKTSVTRAVIVVLLQSYLPHRDLAKVLKYLKQKNSNDKFFTTAVHPRVLPWLPTLELKYPFKTLCELTGQKRAKTCCYMMDKQNQSLQKPSC